MRINPTLRLLCIKVVYYGPGLSGKTTNLARLHQIYPEHQRGEFIQLDTETERTLFFDYFPLSIDTVGGLSTQVDFFTVPGQSFYHTTRRAVLEGADGIVFVADSDPEREDANHLSRQDLAENLRLTGRSLDTLPHVYQWNKRDLPHALPVSLLERTLNPERAPSFSAVASKGTGVWETQGLIIKAIIDDIRQKSMAASAAL